jgi:hypothetical protein
MSARPSDICAVDQQVRVFAASPLQQGGAAPRTSAGSGASDAG